MLAADGDRVAACITKGPWRICEVKLCDARDMTDGAGEPADCTEFDLWSFERGKPDVLVTDIVADNCTTPNIIDVSVLAVSAGVKHVVKDGLTLTATGGSFTLYPVGHRYVQITGSTDGTEGSGGSCNAFTVYGRGLWRLY
jgi:hypothetical protein